MLWRIVIGGDPRTPLSAALAFSCGGLAAAGTEREHYWLKSTGGGCCCKTNSEMVVAPPRPSPSSSTSGSATRGSGSDPPGPAPPVRHLGAGAHARRAGDGWCGSKFSFHPTGGFVPRAVNSTREFDTVPEALPHQLPLQIPFSPRLLNKLKVSPQDTQTSVRVMCVGPRIRILQGSGICPYLRKIWRICLWIWRSKHLHISLDER